MNQRFVPGMFVVAGIGCALIGLCIGCQQNHSAAARSPHALNQYVSAVRAYQDGDQDRAIAALQAALSENQDLAMAHSLLGDIYRMRDDYTHAATQYEAMTRLDPYGYKNYYNLGVSYQFLHRVEDAIASYLDALKLNPSDAQSATNLAMLYLALGRPKEAVQYAQHATEANSTFAAGFANYGVALDAIGDVAKAELMYRKALELDPRQIQVARYMTEDMIRQGRTREARSALAEMLRDKDKDNPALRGAYADALLANREFEDALGEYKKLLKADPKNVALLNQLGATLQAQYEQSLGLQDEKRLEAVATWNQSLKLNPNQPAIAENVKKYSKEELLNH